MTSLPEIAKQKQFDNFDKKLLHTQFVPKSFYAKIFLKNQIQMGNKGKLSKLIESVCL